ncbi:hypothetical protein K457DRAFT_1626777 [Linnemannia elongata AG-77]|uniref:Uncharacterized protein n=1 Tax=Linnemannia elongata AG-77 TaxID=1314771 RepID=A0A197KCX1_9FUNG|nr:hypothetical protein K457DRAFT_1626777 [Linnemannia elongata AG-77]
MKTKHLVCGRTPPKMRKLSYSTRPKGTSKRETWRPEKGRWRKEEETLQISDCSQDNRPSRNKRAVRKGRGRRGKERKKKGERRRRERR